MPAITRPGVREIIDDFAKEIRERRVGTGVKPSETVINYKSDRSDNRERPIYQVPIDILRFRKDNGRIASDVKDYEKNIGPLDEKDDQAQDKIRKFLDQKDPEKTAILKNSILHDGQQEPAIITCDGFIINGNRRKMIIDKLHAEFPDRKGFAYMKVVILPGKGEEGGPPTLLDIEKIENRYQLQSEGKSEYYGFDRALSVNRKIELGFSLEDQLSDDPLYAAATKPQIEKAAEKFTREYLKPLECVDRYLKQFGREGLYRTISIGMSDPQGRWQAFIDYSNTYTRDFNNPRRLIEYGIEEDEIGAIEEAAFDIIRLRVVPDMPKLHVIMRDLPKYCRTKEGKKAIKKIAEEVEVVLPVKERLDGQGEPLSTEKVDSKWAAQNQQPIIYNLKKASRSHESLKEKETPLELMEAALKKLTHDDMDLGTILLAELPKAKKLAGEIRVRISDLESQIYQIEKQRKKLAQKKT